MKSGGKRLTIQEEMEEAPSVLNNTFHDKINFVCPHLLKIILNTSDISNKQYLKQCIVLTKKY
jgi:hypothetical protein